MHSKRPLISVIITNYNYGRYISEAINSVFKQTYRNIELIIINDGSTDNSDSIIRKLISAYPKRNINYVNRKNKGVVYTRNEGIDLAQGEYICYLDADDYFNKDYLEKSYHIAERYGADVVYPNWHFTGEWDGIMPDTDFPEFTPKRLQLQKVHCTPASLIRKKAIGSHRFEAEDVAEDWDFFIGLSLDGLKFKLAKNNFINYRIRTGTRGSRNSPEEDTWHFVKILEKYKEKYDSKVINPDRLVALRRPPGPLRKIKDRTLMLKRILKRDGLPVVIKKVFKKCILDTRLARRVVVYARGKAYQRAVNSFKISSSPDAKLAVIIHLYYPEMWTQIKDRLAHIDIPFDLFLSVTKGNEDIRLNKVSPFHKNTNIITLPNRGRDVLPFLIILEILNSKKQYQFFLKLHTKKSPHRKDGTKWMRELLDELIPSDISNIIRVLNRPKTGLIGPVDHVVSLSRYMGSNRKLLQYSLEHISNELTAKDIITHSEEYPFFGGTMFWGRIDFFDPLFATNIAPGEFNTEKGQVDGTKAHMIERLIGKALHSISGKKMYTVDSGVVHELPNGDYSDYYKYVG